VKDKNVFDETLKRDINIKSFIKLETIFSILFVLLYKIKKFKKKKIENLGISQPFVALSHGETSDELQLVRE